MRSADLWSKMQHSVSHNEFGVHLDDIKEDFSGPIYADSVVQAGPG